MEAPFEFFADENGTIRIRMKAKCVVLTDEEAEALKSYIDELKALIRDMSRTMTFMCGGNEMPYKERIQSLGLEVK